MHRILPLILALCLSFLSCASRKPDHSSFNSLDWAGMYTGTLPCADCEGIMTTIVLSDDLTYLLSTSYLGKDGGVFEERGRFSWSPDGSTITFDGIKQRPASFRVGENTLRQLDMDGHVITGALADTYMLIKQPTPSSDPMGKCILDTRWKLVELMGKPVQPNSSGKFPFLLLSSANTRFSGYGGCNTAGGAFELKTGNRLRFTGMASTLMACPDMNLEQEFFQVLAMTDNFTCDGQILSLNKARMAPLARFEAVAGQ